MTAEAKERFYGLVEKVYLYKLQNGELDRQSYNDVFSAVDDVMKPINQQEGMTEEELNAHQGGWTEEMKS